MLNKLNQQQLAQHITILGWLHIAGNLFFIVIGIFIYFFLTTIGVITGDEQATVILGMVGTFVGALLVLLGLPGVIAGIGLLSYRAWARYLAIVLAVINLLNAPVGTVIGIYALWVLMQEDAVTLFEHKENAVSTGVAHPRPL